MSKNIARLISFALSPIVLFLPTPYILVDRASRNDLYAFKWAIFSYIFLSAVIVFVILGTLLGVFSDFDVSRKEQRSKLFVFGALVSFLYLISLFILRGPKVLFIIVFGIILGVIAVGFVNKWIKASIHTATVSAFSVSLIILYGGKLIPALILIPLMAWARVKIRKHTLSEVIAGGFLGAILTIIVYIVIKFLGF